MPAIFPALPKASPQTPMIAAAPSMPTRPQIDTRQARHARLVRRGEPRA
ncbi:MAG: hypothetical protein ABIP16_05155 [Thermomonas sp.]